MHAESFGGQGCTPFSGWASLCLHSRLLSSMDVLCAALWVGRSHTEGPALPRHSCPHPLSESLIKASPSLPRPPSPQLPASPPRLSLSSFFTSTYLEFFIPPFVFTIRKGPW